MTRTAAAEGGFAQAQARAGAGAPRSGRPSGAPATQRPSRRAGRSVATPLQSYEK